MKANTLTVVSLLGSVCGICRAFVLPNPSSSTRNILTTRLSETENQAPNPETDDLPFALTKGGILASEMAEASREAGLESAFTQFSDGLFEMFSSKELDSSALDNILAQAAVADPELKPIMVEQSLQTFISRAPLTPDQSKRSIRAKLTKAEPFKDVLEANGVGMACVKNVKFVNWGLTVESTPEYTFIPKTKVGLCNLVKWAGKQDLKVRVAGYRHSWSDIFGGNRQVMVSLLPLPTVTELPTVEPPLDPTNELQGIKIVGEITEDGRRKALCKIGAATTNEQFRKWVIANSLDSKKHSWKDWWTVPLNVIMVEITFGGSNGPICHGAGLKTQTLSDLVHSIEFVNAKGELQVVEDAGLLKAASGCFGMLGIVTSITLKLDQLTFANMNPEKKHIALTIPPPKDLAIPPSIDMRGISKADMDAAMAEFVNRCETYYYVEYFWFVSQEKCWINTWQNDGARDKAINSPTPFEAQIQNVMEFLAQLANNSIFRLLPANIQMGMMTNLAMLQLPGNGNQEVVPLIDALHFRRGIQNMRVFDMEWEIPIPPRQDDPSKPDWSICQDAWWAVITNFYNRYEKNKRDVPCRLTMELRITGDSNVLLAPQRGNKFGTCSIEILTPSNVPYDEWLSFMQETVDNWLEYKNIDGSYLNSRPHWAKEWKNLTVRGKPIKEYLKEDAYKDAIPAFAEAIAAIAAAGGYSTGDVKNSFSTPFLEEMFGEAYGK